jgi:hypothetical protein
MNSGSTDCTHESVTSTHGCIPHVSSCQLPFALRPLNGTAWPPTCRPDDPVNTAPGRAPLVKFWYTVNVNICGPNAHPVSARAALSDDGTTSTSSALCGPFGPITPFFSSGNTSESDSPLSPPESCR